MLLTVAVEDVLSEVVARRLIRQYMPEASVVDVLVAGGSVKSNIPRLNQMAHHIGPVLVLADLDRPLSCPAALVQDLLGGLTVAPKMLIRVAVLEIESWIMADREGLAKGLSIAASTVPHNPEEIEDPKRALTHLAANSRSRAIREGIAPRRVRGTQRVGPGYNVILGRFVEEHWSPEAARHNSPSLSRSISRIMSLAAS